MSRNPPRVVAFYTNNPAKLNAFKRKVEAQAKARIMENIRVPQQWADGFGTTVRRNGDVVIGSFRDIVDTERLVNSLQFKWIGLKLFVTSDVPYFDAVLYGYKKGYTNVPGRDFLNLSGEKLG
jgi:hypothetical protein